VGRRHARVRHCLYRGRRRDLVRGRFSGGILSAALYPSAGGANITRLRGAIDRQCHEGLATYLLLRAGMVCVGRAAAGIAASLLASSIGVVCPSL